MPDPSRAPERPAVSAATGAAAAVPGSLEVHGVETAGFSQRQLAWRRFRRHKLAMVSLAVLVAIGLVTVLAGVLTPYGFSGFEPTEVNQGPTAKHWFGTDDLGRDELTRVLYGGRISLAVGVGVALSAGVFGTMVGSISGFYGGRLDNLLMRTTDLFLSIPLLVILILASTVFGGSVFDIVLVLSLFFWMPVARIVRGVFLSLKEKEFIEAARAVGASNRRIIIRHMLPNSIGPIIVNVTLSIATAILTESVLSFLGFGVKPPTPTWGNMLADAKFQALSAPWLVWFPGLMILVTVLAVNFVGDGMRDALDPTQQRIRA